MPLALLLSPDDQAVSAITAVLEEMSVTCERPLDGVAAAKQLNSHNFDLVLVDCENLPAAKLIFDVCRRGNGGKNPVQIAIVNGRAGLPTAFRLGAELILTKPVAKDQARTTVRAAVNRVKKEHLATGGQTAEGMSTGAAQTATAKAGPETAKGQSAAEGMVTTPQVANETLALAAAASAQGQFTGPLTTTSALESAAPTMSAAPSLRVEPCLSSAGTEMAGEETKLLPVRQTSADSVDAKLETTGEKEAETKASATAATSEPEGKSEPGNKERGALGALVATALIASGLYAAWTTQPEFRSLAAPQVERVLAMVGIAQPPAPVKQSIKPAPALVNPVASPAAVAATPSAIEVAVPASSQASSASGAAAQPLAGATPASSAGQSSADSKTTVEKTNPTPNAAGEKGADSTGAAATTPAATGSSGEPVVLSAAGATKRLIQSVQPTYPASARTTATESTVKVKLVVDENGKVRSAQVVDGNPALTESAVSAVKQWRYRPYLQNGKTVPFQTVVAVDFARP